MTGVFSDIMPFRDSHAFLVSSSDASGQRTAIEYSANGAAQTLWESTQGSWSLLSVTDITVNPSAVGPFTAIQ
ncbi:MAG: hypothetical protein L0154_17405 [Chloroflexi bacterium]|nr:hypothetical protein [Chloroflexota bacterium]